MAYSPRIGDSVGRYRLVGPLGAGGMGEVWSAEADLGFGVERRVAVKFIDAAGEHGQLFLDELSVLSQLHHPNLVQLLDSGKHADSYWYAMEWIPGQTLLALMRPGRHFRPLPAAVALTVAIDLCDGLSAVHTATDAKGAPLGIVHRDVAPANVIVTETGFCKLIDFGIALSSGRRAAATNAGVVRGRVTYLSPERLLNDGVDGRADQWALGVVLFEMLAGRRCFEDRDAASTMRAILEQPIDVSSLPAGLRPVVARMVASSAAARFADMAEVRGALEAAARAVGATVSHGAVRQFMRDGERDGERDGATVENTYLELDTQVTPVQRRSRRVLISALLVLLGAGAATARWWAAPPLETSGQPPTDEGVPLGALPLPEVPGPLSADAGALQPRPSPSKRLKARPKAIDQLQPVE